MNRDGAALYEAASVIFIAQVWQAADFNDRP